VNRDGLFELKRRWLPLFILGAAIFGAGLALGVLWLYRESPHWVTDSVVSFLTPTSPTAPPRGTLISAAALAFILVGSGLLVFAIRRISTSEIGAIDSFWWKIAVGMLAGQWWLGQPRLLVLAAGSQELNLLRALKTISNQVTVLGTPSRELVLALAEDESAVEKALDNLNGDLDQTANGLRLRGRFLNFDSLDLLRDALARADVLLYAPALGPAPDYGLTVPDPAAEVIRSTTLRRVLVGEIAATQPDQLSEAAQWCAAHFGQIDVRLVNNNTIQPLPNGQVYQILTGAQARDINNWEAPGQWEVSKLAIFLREAIGGR
jgi:hypothetical protein